MLTKAQVHATSRRTGLPRPRAGRRSTPRRRYGHQDDPAHPLVGLERPRGAARSPSRRAVVGAVLDAEVDRVPGGPRRAWLGLRTQGSYRTSSPPRRPVRISASASAAPRCRARRRRRRTSTASPARRRRSGSRTRPRARQARRRPPRPSRINQRRRRSRCRASTSARNAADRPAGADRLAVARLEVVALDVPAHGTTVNDPDPIARSCAIPRERYGEDGRAHQPGDHPLRGRLRRRHAAHRRPVHERDGGARQRPLDAPRLPGRDPRAGGLAPGRLGLPDPLRRPRHPHARATGRTCSSR